MLDQWLRPRVHIGRYAVSLTLLVRSSRNTACHTANRWPEVVADPRVRNEQSVSHQS